MSQDPRALARPAITALSYNIQGAISATGLSRTRLYGFMQDGELPTFRVGGRVYIAHKDLAALVDRLQAQSDGDAA